MFKLKLIALRYTLHPSLVLGCLVAALSWAYGAALLVVLLRALIISIACLFFFTFVVFAKQEYAKMEESASPVEELLDVAKRADLAQHFLLRDKALVRVIWSWDGGLGFTKKHLQNLPFRLMVRMAELIEDLDDGVKASWRKQFWRHRSQCVLRSVEVNRDVRSA